MHFGVTIAIVRNINDQTSPTSKIIRAFSTNSDGLSLFVKEPESTPKAHEAKAAMLNFPIKSFSSKSSIDDIDSMI